MHNRGLLLLTKARTFYGARHEQGFGKETGQRNVTHEGSYLITTFDLLSLGDD